MINARQVIILLKNCLNFHRINRIFKINRINS